ncbi:MULTISPECIES: RNA ligase family protein [unclassified Acidovorax]|uniref:RNA ligase family protein n=1 Tax=unclassified Acidovorax TaxID=2684926 RepID=UPI00070A418F|nr:MULTISPECIES: RNA ligase family protein [unclassified Acidovorax]KRC19496.1 DNA ligase [Acidovorax sp. Root219]MDP4073596.1 RNA ligase family protein [Acidovorax sp. A1169]
MTHTFLHNRELAKYPRTPHLQGSRYQPGDKGDPVPYAELLGKTIVVEEKLDAANAGLSFDAAGQLLLQSRGHYLDVDRLGGRERQFNLFKQWARAHEGRLLDVLEDRYVLYGEFMHAKHSVYYDALPHLFCEFDIRDRRTGDFLDTPARHALLAGVPVVSVPVLYAGLAPPRMQALQALLAPSLARTGQWRAAFEDEVARQGLDLALCWQQTDRSELAEGLYIKVEEGGRTVGRFKLVRPDFIQTILDSQSHHSERPVIPNRLRAGVDLFGPEVDKRWPLAGGGRL